jgi:hypothetical protein
MGNRSAAVVCREGTTAAWVGSTLSKLSTAYFIYLVCTEGLLEIVNQTFRFDNDLESFSGVVQVCVDGKYVYVCADNWDNREADVVCRSYASYYQPPYYGIMTLQYYLAT